MREQWKPIPDFPDYEISTVGRVKRIKGWSRRKTIQPYFLKFQISKHGYKVIALYHEGRQYQYRLHQLVARTFIGSCPKDHQVNHINFDKLDNRVSNLEYVTLQENVRHCVKHMRHSYGEKRWSAKLRDSDIQKIRQWLKNGCSESCVAHRYGVSRKVMYDISRNKIWRHVKS